MSIYDKSSLVLIPSGTKTGKVYSQKPVSGDGDFTFTRSSAATRVNADGNIEKETQNLLLQSNSFDTGWSFANANVTGGQAGYDGSNDAWLLTKTAGFGRVQRGVSVSGVHTASVYVKAGSLNWCRFLMLPVVSGTDPQVYINLSDGSLGSEYNNITATSTSVGNGWYRLTLTFQQAITEFRIYPADANNNVSGTGSIYIQDAQLEQGLVARDYIETTTTAVEGGITDNVPRLDYTDSSCPALLLEPQRTNLISYSEYFEGSYWNTNSNALRSLSSNLSPEGTANAYRIEAVSGTQVGYVGVTTIGTTIKHSLYVRRISGSTTFNMVDVNNVSTQVDITNDWKRFSVTASATSTNLRSYLRLKEIGDVVEIFGFQAEEGSYATSYIPTYGSSVTRVKEVCEVTSAEDLIGQTEGTIAGEFNYDSGEPTNRLFSIAGADWNTIGSIRFDIISLKPQATIRANGGEPAKIIGTQDINVGTLVKFAVVYTSTTLKMFVNGSQIGSTATLSGSLPSTLDEIRINALGGSFVSDTQNNQLNPYKQALVFKTALTDQEAIDLTTI